MKPVAVRFRTWLSCAVLGALVPAAAAGDDGVATNVIQFKALSNDSDKGVVRCGLFREGGWLKKAVRPAIVKINGKTALCVFKQVPKGEYAISAFHDANDNGELDTNVVGYPVEQYCASNNARNTFSAPSWSDAKFSFAGGTLELEAHMK